MKELRSIADRLVEKFLTTDAIESMLGTPENGGDGDDAQFAFCLTLRDLVQYHEACCGTSNGDPKRVYQIILVCFLIANLLVTELIYTVHAAMALSVPRQ